MCEVCEDVLLCENRPPTQSGLVPATHTTCTSCVLLLLLTCPSLLPDSSRLVRMVASYLVHHSYCATAEAFAKSTDQAVHEELASIKNRQSESSAGGGARFGIHANRVPSESNTATSCDNQGRPLTWGPEHVHIILTQASQTGLLTSAGPVGVFDFGVLLSNTLPVGLQRSRSWCCRVEWARPSRPPSSSTPTSWRGTQTSSSCSSKTSTVGFREATNLWWTVWRGNDLSWSHLSDSRSFPPIVVSVPPPPSSG